MAAVVMVAWVRIPVENREDDLRMTQLVDICCCRLGLLISCVVGARSSTVLDQRLAFSRTMCLLMILPNKAEPSSLDYDGERVVYGSTARVLDGEELTMRLLVDRSIVEGFVQEGGTVMTSRVYLTKAIYEGAKVYLFNNATGTSVKASLKIWKMAPVWIQPYPS
nr:beta-fructofuranosidase, soluble isoenzyme I-like [Tanacetum cinerariifolium]